MAQDNIVVVARIKARIDKVDEAKAAALAIVEDSRNESGCINHDIHRSIEDDTVFIWHGAWVNKAAIDEHFTTPFFQEFFETVSEIAAEPPQIYLTRKLTD
jgi:quinol monooxygenase YgiN